MKLEDRIIHAFKADPELIDNPEALLYRVWLDCVPVQFRAYAMHEFMRRVLAGQIDIPNPMTINRVRQQIQETYPEYRGKLRQERMERASNISNEIQSSKFEKLI